MLKLTENKIVALVGMSGAGKSTVCRQFADNSFYIIDCDKCAREVTEIGSNALKELKTELSPDIINADGSLNRRLTSEIIFNNADKRAIFNRIIYPYITYNVIVKIKNAAGDVLLDAPTLFEAGLDSICDSIVAVCADTETCINRITLRDNIDYKLAAARLSSQHDIIWYKERADYCILNNGTQQQLFTAAAEVIGKLKGA